ncbi:unnamed protein product, partial [Discosporangium mesarthrocarpum]
MSKLLDPARLQKEIDAQKKRAEALAHLHKHGCGPSEYEKNVQTKGLAKAEEEQGNAVSKRDNTLEAMAVRRAQQTYKEMTAKEALLKQQAKLRDGLGKKATAGHAAGGGGTGGWLEEGWQEVKDLASDSVYYWNKKTGKTSWTRPSAAAAGPGVAKVVGGQGANDVQNRGGSGGKGDGVGAGEEDSLPEGWKAVKDPKTGEVYYWNQARGETTWSRPSGHSSGAEGLSSRSPSPSSSSPLKWPSTATGGLPEGWKRVDHAATGQTYFVHEGTGERSFTRPKEGGGVRQGQELSGKPPGSGPTAETKGGSGGGLSSPGHRQPGRKRGRGGGGVGHAPEEIDPLDPTGKKGGRWSDGLVAVGERMADSTASGPLWQQRPYPAPGKILR